MSTPTPSSKENIPPREQSLGENPSPSMEVSLQPLLTGTVPQPSGITSAETPSTAAQPVVTEELDNLAEMSEENFQCD